MKKILLLIFSVLLAGLIDCAGPLSVALDPDMDPSLLIRKVNDHAARLRTMQGNARLVVNSEMGNFQGGLVLKAHMPDSLYARVEGPFGVDVAALQLVADSLTLYNPFMQTVYKGSLNDQSFAAAPIPLQADDMVYALGLIVISEKRSEDISLMTEKDGQYTLYFKDHEKIRIHPRGPVVTQWIKTDDQGNDLWSWSGLNFKKSGGVRLPGTIRIQTENPKQRVSVHYLKFQVNKHLKSGWSRLKLPEGVSRIAL